MSSRRDKAFERLIAVVEPHVAWNRGIDYKWEGQALMAADFLADLVRLAFEAPLADRMEFIEQYKGEPTDG